MRIVRVSTHLCGADTDIAVLLDDNDVLRGSKLAQIGVTNECRSRPMRARDLNLLETATRSLQASVPRSASYAGRRVRTALLSGVAESVRRYHPSFLDDPKTDCTGTVNALPILRYKAFGGTQVPKSVRNRWKTLGSHRCLSH